MRVCSFNIWSDAPLNHRWRLRRNITAELLRHRDLDLIGIQEATAPMVRDLHERLPQYSWIGAGRDDGKEAGEFTPILFQRERMTPLEYAHFWLAADCTRPGPGWDARHSRIVTWVRFAESASGRRFVHFNTHLDHLGRNARVQSARLLVQKAAEIAAGDSVLITGDFNCRESSAAYRILTGKIPFASEPANWDHFRDTYHDCQHAPEGPRRTYLGLLGLLGLGRIDYIFVNACLRTLRHLVIDDAPSGSDHRPVVAELAFAPAEP